MPLWLVLIIAGTALVILHMLGIPGFDVIGVILLVIGIVLVLVGRGGQTVGRPRL